MGDDRERGSGGIVVVPDRPGPLIPLEVDRGRRRAPDELDDLIDELLPDVGDGPGWTDGLFVVVGLAVVGWSIATSGPGWLLVAGVIAVALGCVLPARALWRGAADRRRMRVRARVESSGTPLDVTAPATAGLVDAYRDLLRRLPEGDPDASGAALAAAHAAVLEVATLCQGRPPTRAEEPYVERRAVAIAELARSLAREAGPADHHDDPVIEGPAPVVEARDELDVLTGTSSIGRLLELADRPVPRHGDR